MMERGKCEPYRPFSDRMPEVPGGGTHRISVLHSRRLHGPSPCRCVVDNEVFKGRTSLVIKHVASLAIAYLAPRAAMAGEAMPMRTVLMRMHSKDIAAKLFVISTGDIL